MDLMFGLVAYAVLAWGFGRTYSPADLVVVLCFAIGPDLDWLPFLLFKRRFKLISHWLIHFPLLYIPIGATLTWITGGEWFYVTAFVLTSVMHFLHDAASVPGIQWLWPFSRTAHAVHKFHMVRVGDEDRCHFYEQLREGASSRSFWGEVKLRLGKGRPEWFRCR